MAVAVEDCGWRNDLDLFSAIGTPEPGDTWKESTDIAQYLNELSCYQVQKLSQEPARLAEEKGLVLEQARELAYENYKTFIQAAQCSKDIFEEFSAVKSRLQVMQSKLPEFAKKCEDFSHQSRQITSRWWQMSLILSKHPQLLEILELSQLMDTCVRNGCYDEALELAGYVRRLERKHGTIPLILCIADEMQESLHVMLSQLLQQILTTIQLPACLKVLGYLRRMDAFSQSELCIMFLQARSTWLQSMLNSIPTKDAYVHITRVVDVFRVHLFDVITQYTAIFSEEDPISRIAASDVSEPVAAICCSWVTRKLSEFLSILQSDLQKDMGGRIDSVLSQCMYFGLSFSRVGVDFRSVLASKFQTAVMVRYASAVSEATLSFEEMMHNFTLANLPSVGSAAVHMSSLTAEESPHTPICLLEFEPLSQYLNRVLATFNELRLCACLGVAKDASVVLHHSLQQVVTAVIEFHTANESTVTEKESEAFPRLCGVLAGKLVPFLDHCLSILFPSSKIMKIFGIAPQQLAKMKNMGRLDCDTLIDLVKPLLIDFVEDGSVSPNTEANVESTGEQNKQDNTDEAIEKTPH